MVTSTLSHRRKGTTYGKTNNKAFVSSSFIANDFAHSPWETRFETLPRESSTGEADLEENRASGRIHPCSTAVSCKKKSSHDLKNENLRPAAVVSRVKSTPVFDLTPSEKKEGDSVITTDDSKRKRRKLAPANATDQLFPVFDDNSLQKHIAAQVQAETDIKVKRINRSTPVHRSISKNTNLGPAIKDDHQPLLGKEVLEGNTEARGDQAKPFKVRERPCNKAADPQHEVASQHQTPDVLLLHAASLHSGGQKATPGFKECRIKAPSTPPRPTRPTSSTSTPRQRELWNQLLVHGNCAASPSYLDLHGLRITDSKPSSGKEPSSYSRCSTKNEECIEQKSRHKRLVDILRPSDRSQSAANEGFSSGPNDFANCSSHGLSQCDKPNDYTDDTVSTAQTAQSVISRHRHVHMSYQAPSAPPHATASFQPGGPRVTYAQQRSYLNDNAIGEAVTSDMQSVSEDQVSGRSWCQGLDMPKLKTKDIEQFEFVEGLVLQGGAMRSIHELREAGGNARLVGEFETSLDELDEAHETSISATRSALIVLVSKLQDAANCRVFVDKSLEARLLFHVGHRLDPITSSLFAAGILRLMAHSTSTILTSLVDSTHIKSFLVQLLGSDQDLSRTARSRDLNMPRLAQRDYTALCTSLLTSTIWRAAKPQVLSCQTLSLQCLEYLVRQRREGGFAADILSAAQIQRLVETSIPSVQTWSHQHKTTLVHLELAISTLDSCIICSAHESQKIWSEFVLERIRSVLPGLGSSLVDDSDNLQVLTLRLYLNMTNSMPPLCEAFARPDVVDAIFEIVMSHFKSAQNGNMKHQQPLLDKAILSLGCLINLAESSDTMRQFSIQERDGNSSVLDALLAVFLRKRREVAEVCLHATLA